jgi:hypothetical protein
MPFFAHSVGNIGLTIQDFDFRDNGRFYCVKSAKSAKINQNQPKSAKMMQIKNHLSYNTTRIIQNFQYKILIKGMWPIIAQSVLPNQPKTA